MTEELENLPDGQFKQVVDPLVLLKFPAKHRAYSVIKESAYV
jgi:hypothetical protein